MPVEITKDTKKHNEKLFKKEVRRQESEVTEGYEICDLGCG